MGAVNNSLDKSNVFFNDDGYQHLNTHLTETEYSNLFILVDSNTHSACLPYFLGKIKTSLATEIIEIEPGEENKNLETCNSIWKVLSELGADRKSLLINLGGGVVTDLGGFVAATFKRGISFLNFPTTLLAMVDAAVGGKTGVNLEGLKNQIGVIQSAEMVIADTSFLKSLPPAEMRSGLAEMLKHGLIKDETYWEKLNGLESLNLDDLDELIFDSIVIKQRIVEADPLEKNIRKSLNFGHTLGHAIETYFLESTAKQKLLHGEAVAAGMVMAAFISAELLSFPKEKLVEIKKCIGSMYGTIGIEDSDREQILELMKFDKKNEGGKINFVLLKNIGEPVIDCHVPQQLLIQAFDYYLSPEN